MSCSRLVTLWCQKKKTAVRIPPISGGRGFCARGRPKLTTYNRRHLLAVGGLVEPRFISSDQRNTTPHGRSFAQVIPWAAPKKNYLFGGWLRNLPFDPLRGSLYFSPSGQVPVLLLLATTYECTFGSWLALGLEKWWIMTHKQTHTHAVGGAAVRFLSFFFFDAMASFFMAFWVSFDEVDNGGEPYRVKLHTYV